MSDYAKLPRRHQLFVDAFVQCGVGTQALRQIGFKGKAPNCAASKLMALPQIRAALKERTDEHIAAAGITPNRTLTQLAACLHFDPRELVDKDGTPLPLHRLSDRVAAAIGSVEIEERTEGEGANRATVRRYKYRARSVEAHRLTLQYLHLLSDHYEHTGFRGGPIVTKDLSEPSELDRARRVAFLLAAGMREVKSNGHAPVESGDETESAPAGSR